MPATRTSVLAPGATGATSTVISVPQGSVYTVQLYTTGNARIPSGSLALFVVTSTGNQPLAGQSLNRANNAAQLSGPGDYYVVRPAGVDVGVEVVT